LKDLTEALGRETIDSMSFNESRGNSASFGRNFQRMGKELMSRDELEVLDGDDCILQLRGVRPFKSPKYDITKHKNYRFLSGANPKNEFDVAKYLARRQDLQPEAEEIYEIYEIEREEDE
jgi:type IV secretion system protein VirD4